ncbi:hypothetical protein QCA50_011540 [Cerrena zonata]|uniref:Uncharacterized protein n=1 Tax=Cerrena zonata TaxID=2478898 RepID=A0AAW0FYD7_9APHY
MAVLATNDTFPRLNPDAPMAFLPPDLANQYVAGTYLIVAVIGAWFMDVILSIPDEIRIYKKRPFRLPDLLYFLSRIAFGGFVLTSFIISSAPLHSCPQVLVVTACFSGLTTPLNSSLFLLRIWGVFHGSKVIIGFFSLFWLSTFTSFVSAFNIKTHPIGPTQYCIVEAAPQIIAIAFIVAAAYDTLVFLAITMKIVLDSPAEGWKAKTSLLFTGEKMGYISRALLQTGQIYYFVAVSTNIIILAVVLNHSVPIVFKPAVTAPMVALQNLLACRVFRLLKLGSLKTNPDMFRPSVSSAHDQTLTSIQFNPPADVVRRDISVLTIPGSQNK